MISLCCLWFAICGCGMWIAVFTCGLVFEMAKQLILFDCFSKATETTEVDGK